MTPQATDPALIERYVSGTATIAERECVEWQLQHDEAYRIHMRALRTAWVTQLDARTRWDDQSASQRILAKTNLRGTQHRVAKHPRLFGRSFWYGASAAFVAIALLAGVWRINTSTTGPSPEYMMYSTGNAERATITLPDGSTVQLNVATQLQVPMNYGTHNRTVTLSGEGLFQVLHHDNAPFVVVTQSSTTRVLGTRFVVRHYVTDSVATIAVQEGKVAVGDIVVSASQQIHVGPKQLSAVSVADDRPFSFASGVLSLDGMSLEEAIPDINRWYNTEIRLADASLASRRIKGGLPGGSLGDLTTLLQLMFDVHVVRDGRVLTLYAR